MIGISAGNHAQALAWGAARRGSTASSSCTRARAPAKVAATRGYGAAVDLEAADAVEAFARLDEHIRETGRTLVHPFDDPLVIAGQGRSRSSCSRTRPRSRRSSSPTAVAGSSPVSPPRRPTGASSRSSRSARRRCTTRSRPGSPCRVTPDSIADGLSAPVRGRDRARRPSGARASRACSSPRRRSRRRSGSSTCARSSRANPPQRSAVAAVLAGQAGDGPIGVVVSGGNVAAETASAILARR